MFSVLLKRLFLFTIIYIFFIFDFIFYRLHRVMWLVECWSDIVRDDCWSATILCLITSRNTMQGIQTYLNVGFRESVLRPKKKDCWFPLTLPGQLYPAWSINFIGFFSSNKYFWSQPYHFFQHELEIFLFFFLSMDTRIKLSYLLSKEE